MPELRQTHPFAITAGQKVEAIEALSHPCKPARRLFEIAATWPESLKELKPRPAVVYKTAPRPPAESVVEELVEAYESGTSIRKLATQFGIHRHTISKHLQAHGIEMREPRISPEQVQEAAELYCGGWSLARLGAKFGIDDGTMRSRLLEVGVVMRPRRGGRQSARRSTAAGSGDSDGAGIRFSLAYGW